MAKQDSVDRRFAGVGSEILKSVLRGGGGVA